MYKIFITLLLITFSFVITANEAISLTINIISHSLDNGAGKEADVAILKGELESLGHQVELFDYHKVNSITAADINLFLAQFKPNWFSKAKLNWFIPNPECCDANPEAIEHFDLILCKTHESLKIFSKISNHTYYLGFTSIDRYSPSIRKHFSRILHVAGKSRMKGTDRIFKAWTHIRDLPYLTVIDHHHHHLTQKPSNLKLISKRIPTSSLIKLQNECGIHLCPSRTEGFGHYIMEAMAAGAVVVTTDAPPMNEFIKDKRCLVDYSSTGTKKYATTYLVDEDELGGTLKRLSKLSSEELKNIGKLNRAEYHKRKAEFKQNFQQVIQMAEHQIANM